jgi:hypothetical protein
MLLEVLTHVAVAAGVLGAVVAYRRTLGRPKHVRAHASYKQLIRKREKLSERIAAAKADAMKGPR